MTINLPNNFRNENLELHLICDSYIGLDQCYNINLDEVNKAMGVHARPEKIVHQNNMDADFDEMESMMQYDPEIDYEMQPQNMPGGKLVEDDDVKTVRGDDPPEESKY